MQSQEAPEPDLRAAGWYRIEHPVQSGGVAAGLPDECRQWVPYHVTPEGGGWRFRSPWAEVPFSVFLAYVEARVVAGLRYPPFVLDPVRLEEETRRAVYLTREEFEAECVLSALEL